MKIVQDIKPLIYKFKSLKNMKNYNVVVKNDNVNSFENVINALMLTCEYDMIRSEQLATLVHLRGEIPVKENVDYFDAMELSNQLKDTFGLNTEIKEYQNN